jgi:hypothetical protein
LPPTAGCDLVLLPRPVALLLAEGGARWAGTAGQGAAEFDGSLRLGPVGGMSIFASAAGGARVLGLVRSDTLRVTRVEETEDGPRTVDDLVPTWSFPSARDRLRATRVGAEWGTGSLRAGGAVLSLHGDTVAPHALPFDRGFLPIEAAPARGFEIYARVPVPIPGLRVEGWHASWRDTGFRPYLPTYQTRASLGFYGRFYAEQFEPDLRLEFVRRGPSLVPAMTSAVFASSSEAYQQLDLHLNVRVVDLRFFLAWENVLDLRTLSDLGPAGEPTTRFPLPGQRVLYGIRWSFFN